MVDTPRLPRMRSQTPSAPELWDAITESHRLDSSPPAAVWLQRRVGWIVLRFAHWVFRTKTGSAFCVAVGGALWELVRHLPAWVERLMAVPR